MGERKTVAGKAALLSSTVGTIASRREERLTEFRGKSLPLLFSSSSNHCKYVLFTYEVNSIIRGAMHFFAPILSLPDYKNHQSFHVKNLHSFNQAFAVQILQYPCRVFVLELEFWDLEKTVVNALSSRKDNVIE